MHKTREVLRLYFHLKLGQRQIVRSTNVSQGTVLRLSCAFVPYRSVAAQAEAMVSVTWPSRLLLGPRSRNGRTNCNSALTQRCCWGIQSAQASFWRATTHPDGLKLVLALGICGQRSGDSFAFEPSGAFSPGRRHIAGPPPSTLSTHIVPSGP